MGYLRCAIVLCLFQCAVFAQTQISPPVPHKDTIIVTGTPDPLPLEESNRSVNVRGTLPDGLLLIGGFQSLLQLDSSVDLQQRAPGGVQGDISIRGGTFGQTLVLVNGLRINDVQTGHHNLDLPVPLDAIGQMEVLRGAGSTLYGSDAVGGVVNVLTHVAEQPELIFRSGIGSFGTNDQSGHLSLVGKTISQQFSFARELSDGFEDDREYRSVSGSSETLLRTRFGLTRVFLSLLDRPFGANQFYGNYNSWERTKTWYAALQQDIGNNTNVSFSYRRHTDIFVLLRDNPEIYTNHHADETWDATVRRHNDLFRFTRLSYGVEGTADRIDSNSLGLHNRNQGAAYATLDIRALRRFSLSFGAREEFFGHRQTFFAPTVSGGAWLSDRIKLRASVSRAFRRPTYTDLYYEDPANLGNPNLKPEEAMSYEGGADWHLGQRWTAAATIFRRNEKNGIDYVRASSSDPWQATNFDRLQYTGVEAGVEARLAHSQQLSLQYTGIRGTQAQSNGEQSKYAFNYPVHEAVAGWQLLSAKGLLARSRIGTLQRYQKDAYALWDVYIAYTRFRVRPYVQVTNLTSTRYQEINGIDMPGRSAMTGLEIALWQPHK